MLVEFQEQIAAWKIKYYVNLYRQKCNAAEYEANRKLWGRQSKVLRNQILNLRKDIENFHQEDLHNKNEDLKAENKALKEIFTDMKGTNNELNLKVEEMKRSLQDMETSITQTRAQHEAKIIFSNGQMEESRHSIALLREELEVSRRACQDCMKTIASLDSKLAETTKDVQVWKDIAAASGFDSAQRSVDLDNMLTEKNALVDELTAKLLAVEKKLEGERMCSESLTQKVHVLENHANGLQDQLNRDSEFVLKCSEEKSSLHRLITEVTLQSHTAEKKYDKLNELYKDLTRNYNAKLEDLSNQNDRLNLESTTLQATQNIVNNCTLKIEDLSIKFEQECMAVEDMEERSRLQIGALMHLTSYSHMLEMKLSMHRQDQYLETAHLGGYSPQLSYADPRNNPLLKHFDLLFDFNGNIQGSSVVLSGVGNDMHSPGRAGDHSQTPFFGNGSIASPSGSITSAYRPNVTHPLESRLMALLSVLENKVLTTNTTSDAENFMEVNNDIDIMDQTVKSKEVVKDNKDNKRQQHDSDDNLFASSNAMSVDVLENLVVKINDSKELLENYKLQLAEIKYRIQTIQDEKSELQRWIAQWQSNEYNKTGKIPKSGNSTESKACFKRLKKLDIILQEVLEEAQVIATYAMETKSRCDDLQDELDEAYRRRKIEHDSKQEQDDGSSASSEKNGKAVANKELKKPAFHRNTVSILNDPSLASAAAFAKRNTALPEVLEEEDEDDNNEEEPHSRKGLRDNDMYGEEDRGSSGGQLARPKTHKKELEQKESKKKSKNKSKHDNNYDDHTSFNGNYPFSDSNSYDQSQRYEVNYENISDMQPSLESSSFVINGGSLRLDEGKYEMLTRYTYEDFRHDIDEHRNALFVLNDEKWESRRNIERWTIYFLKDQRRLPGLTDTKYGSNNYIFELFNSIQHEIYSHHTAIVDISAFLSNYAADVYNELQELLNDQQLEFPENGEYEDAYKIHFESVESLLATDLRQLQHDDDSFDSCALYNPIGIMNFDALHEQAKLDVLTNIDMDLNIFHEDVSELHAVLRECRNTANSLNDIVLSEKLQLQEWINRYTSVYNSMPSDEVIYSSIPDTYNSYQHHRTTLAEELEKMRVIAIVATSKVSESEKLRLLHRRFTSKAPSSYAGSGENSRSSLSRVYSGDINDAMRFAAENTAQLATGINTASYVESTETANTMQQPLALAVSNHNQVKTENVKEQHAILGLNEASTYSEDISTVSIIQGTNASIGSIDSNELKIFRDTLLKDINKLSEDINILTVYSEKSDFELESLKVQSSAQKKQIQVWKDEVFAKFNREPNADDDQFEQITLFSEENKKIEVKISEIINQRERARVMLSKLVALKSNKQARLASIDGK